MAERLTTEENAFILKMLQSLTPTEEVQAQILELTTSTDSQILSAMDEEPETNSPRIAGVLEKIDAMTQKPKPKMNPRATEQMSVVQVTDKSRKTPRELQAQRTAARKGF